MANAVIAIWDSSEYVAIVRIRAYASDIVVGAGIIYITGNR